LLTTILQRMGVEATSKKSSDLIEQIETEIHYLGLSAIFSNCTSKQLQAFTKDMGLTVESTAKTVLLRCILENKSYTAADKPKVVRKPKEKKEKTPDADGDVEMDFEDDPAIRAPPPQFDWIASEDDSEDYKLETGPETEDIAMSDDSEESEEDPDEEQEDDEDPEDGEYEDKDDE